MEIAFIDEARARDLVSMADAIGAVEAAFAALAREEALAFPVVREAVPRANAVFGVKAGVDVGAGVLGLKAGGFWAGNAGRGLPNHQSTTLLFEFETGRPRAVVCANRLTGLRTAAASALATRHLAGPDAKTLGLVGAGGQAIPQLDGVLAVRRLERLLLWAPSDRGIGPVLDHARARGLRAEAADLETVCREADILTTITPAREALVRRDWLRPGVHVNAMGADTAGKQEFEIAAVAEAALYVDDWEQAIAIGECQHAHRAGAIDRGALRGTLGELVVGTAPGRRAADEITFFDGTGLAIQDLAVAEFAWRRLAAQES